MHDPVSLCGGVALNRLSRPRAEGNLSRDKKQRSGADGLGVGADRRWRFVGLDGLTQRQATLTGHPGSGDCQTGYAALMTLFERRQRVHTWIRLTPPLMTALTRWMFGLNVRLVTLCA